MDPHVLMIEEAKLDAQGRPLLRTIPAEDQHNYPTGFGISLGKLTKDQRMQLFKGHSDAAKQHNQQTEAAKRHAQQAEAYFPPADIDMTPQ